ncbi:Dolichol kinase sec59 [Cytospora mali]|uniref:dolichol kinase n=1 Tax=Cytospora mali TaxID=578113 RepID=A0A194V9X0_CYTMA|nr:Dolichol kinase sec59 [Valsa mali var. pyri (nom. inval.)]
MSNNLEPPRPNAINATSNDLLKEKEELRGLSRSPHPYHRQKWELLEPSDRITSRASSIPTHRFDDVRDQFLPAPGFIKDSTPTTDSGTEADDENFVKRLPAPRARLHKGLRGRPEPPSGVATPLLTPTALDGDLEIIGKSKGRIKEDFKRILVERTKRNKEVIRRGSEVLILSGLAKLVISNPDVKTVVASWGNELRAQCALFSALLAIYPLRVIIWAYGRGQPPRRRLPLSLPSSFDPAPVLYPQVIPILVALLTAANVRDAVLSNLILSIASLPRALIPTTNTAEIINPLHWLISCLPLISSEESATFRASQTTQESTLPREMLVLIYPLHQTLCLILHYLTTTSLLPAELQLLSISLINLLVLASSPTAVILQALLWIGGLGVIILCSPVIKWGIALARVPKWRFQRVTAGTKRASIFKTILNLISLKKLKIEYGSETEGSAGFSDCTTDEDDIKKVSVPRRQPKLSHEDELGEGESLARAETISFPRGNDMQFDSTEEAHDVAPHSRRHSLPFVTKLMNQSKNYTPSGRRKRSASSSVRSFFSLTQSQATTRKWIYAAWLYTCIVAIILGAVRTYVQSYALDGHEPIGWALGYLFGDMPRFRFQVVQANLERWIWLTPRVGDESCHQGWVQHLRLASIGEANTRMLLAAYWVAIIVVGLAVVFRLSPFYEVDTRRKVFHFMMVAMFLPSIYIDPAWCALALALVLAIFLLLDLLRASQLPPVSKPIANFLHPYTDGRDHCGPVVISHIFLLIGCAIPLWLSLASLPREGSGHMRGWEIPTRELSMVSGVVCVGLGDAAASLIGRRYGHHKWLWKGGKSLEGSVAFSVAVFFGLLAANIWLKVGGWPITAQPGDLRGAQQGLDSVWSGLLEWDWTRVVRDTSLCATTASLTEAVLTGGNDNVVVPVVLWTCVKSTGL